MESNTFYIDAPHLAAFGENTAKQAEVSGSLRGGKISADIRQALGRLQERSESADPVEAGSFNQWLEDNWYLTRREGLDAAGAFRRAGRLTSSGDKALIVIAADEMLRSGAGEISAERICIFLSSFQKSRPLPRQELYLFIPALKYSIIKALLSGADEELGGDRAGRLMTSLRYLGNADLSKTMESLDLTERALMQDPAGVYPQMSDRSRDWYRRRVETLSKKQNLPEHLVAKRMLQRANNASGAERHVGFHIFNSHERSGLGYIAANVLISLALSIAAGLHFGFFAFLILLLPVSAAVKSILDWLMLRVLEVRHIPRLELKDGIPPEGKTVCVISALITDEKCGRDLAKQLEQFKLCTPGAGDNLVFGLLADLPESSEKDIPDSKKWMSNAVSAIDQLNRRYSGGFVLLTRSRVLREGKYMGWERKRGAILELARTLTGSNSALRCNAGDLQQLMGAKYILTLDSDTQLAPDSALELIGTMLHPLNHPVIDEKRGVVVSGHGIIQPRMSTQLRSAIETPFAKLFAGQGGIDPYSSASGEVYMDMSGSGGFAGKGIIDAAAFVKCADIFPEGCVLSHDALEGAYLRGGRAGDIELTDSFPGNVLSFYRRAHRWIRGDWQNLPWLFSQGKALTSLDRWRLFDSLRRSLVAPMTLICLLHGFWSRSASVGTIALICYIVNLVIAAISTIVHRPETGERYYSTVISGLPGALCQSLFMLILLPYEAYIYLSAALTALWRMFVTRRGLLEWVTAAQGGAKGAVSAYVAAMLPAMLIGVICIFFSPAVIGRAAGVLWLCSPLLSYIISREYPSRHHKLNHRDRCYLLTRTREMWDYFAVFLNKDNNFLPPDNWQERPPVGLAKRTSPTNIGLALTSTMAAADLGIIESSEAAELINNTLTTIEKMDKWNGHLYNWYSTSSLEVLAPRYVSTVDSGNLCACLIALAHALSEYGYDDLADRAHKIADDMSFTPLLDEEKMLLRIGISLDGQDSGGCYDLLAGEARLTAYLAVARGDVPRKVWERMSRALVAKGQRRGMASWTGTMFEYLMPELLLPVTESSLLYETHHFCLYVQKKRSGNLPWGSSESAYGALDPSLSYRYKAHGCQALALKPGMDSELVISPYSSFLALCVDAEGAVKNLRKIEGYGAIGRFGFWEALDCTPSRMRADEPEIVRCVMAHHLGMSMIAVANIIQNGVWQQRFMRERSMSAYSCLLEERIPINAPILRRSGDTKQLSRPDRPRGLWETSGEIFSGDTLHCNVLTNGTYAVMSTSMGSSVSKCGDILMYAEGDELLGDSRGIDFFLTTDGETLSLLPDGSGSFAYSHTQRESSVQSRLAGLSGDVKTMVCADCSGEVRIVTLSHDSQQHSQAALTVALKPVLAFENDYINHPAFFGLGLHAEKIGGGLLIRRLKRNALDECYLCVKCNRGFEADFSENSMTERANSAPQSEGWLVRPTLRLDIPLELIGESHSEIRISLGFGGTREQAIDCADKALSLEEAECASLPELSGALLELGSDEVNQAMLAVPHILFPRARYADKLEQNEGRSGLWSFGISGDWPIVVYRAETETSTAQIEQVLKRCSYLQSLSLPFDLAVVVSDAGDYYRKESSRIQQILAKHGLEHLLGAHCGIHLADSSKDLRPLLSAAALVLTPEGEIPEDSWELVNNNIFMSTRFPHYSGQDMPQAYAMENGGFGFNINRSLPPRTWTNMLTNGRFGYIATDCGTGFMWLHNARECPITPWLNEPAAVRGFESLEIELGDCRHSLFASPDGETKVSFYPGAAVWQSSFPEGRVSVTAFVPQDTDARVLIIESDMRATIHWRAPLSLSPNRSDRPYVISDYVNRIFTAHNPRADAAPVFRACANVPEDGYTCDFLSARRGEYDAKGGAGLVAGFAARYLSDCRVVLVCGCEDEEVLRALASPEAAKAALTDTLQMWSQKTGRLTITTPYPELDRAISTWVPYQAIACRVLGRTSVYQSGGAIGFRDQLQDVCSLILTDPGQCRKHILESCRHQYLEGDVQHWWHPNEKGDRGVRTMCSDDLVWLPWAACEYVDKTGDKSIWDEQVPYIESAELREGERDRYETPAPSQQQGSVLEHCQRALDMVLRRGTGEHGLLQMLGGDWNDGMDKVGGESVWLTWFFAHTARRFAESTDLKEYIGHSETLIQAADSAWDGEHWRRGYFATGEALGSDTSECCRIDSIAQSFASWCKGISPERLSTALQSALNQLESGQVINLFTPPFENSSPDPGYIQSYGPGFRENGGQYTHAAIWLSMACLNSGKRADGLRLLLSLLPERHDALTYGAEPFVLPADVSSNPDHFGKAGWTWYTGSAGWYWRVVIEDLLGIRAENGRVHIKPLDTPGLNKYSFVWRSSDGSKYSVAVKGGKVTVNGAPYDGKGLPL